MLSRLWKIEYQIIFTYEHFFKEQRFMNNAYVDKLFVFVKLEAVSCLEINLEVKSGKK